MILLCGFVYSFKELSKLSQILSTHSLIVLIMHTHTLTHACSHRPAAYPAFYQLTKVEWTGLEEAVKGADGSCAHIVCCKNINTTLADREFSDTVSVMQSLLMPDREKKQSYFIKCKGKEARTKQTKQELGEKGKG